MKSWRLFLTMMLSVVVLLPGTAAAEEVAGRNFGHSQKTELMEVGDVPEHFMGVIRYYGLTFYTKGPDTGDVASRMGTTLFDVVMGKGTSTGYEVKSFKDGSTVVLKWGGTQSPTDGGKKTAYEGTWEVTGGTGRFAGAKGSGTYKGERIGDAKTGADNYIDFSGSVTTMK